MDGGKKHLTTANLSGNQECRLCCEEGSEETPIHIFQNVKLLLTPEGSFLAIHIQCNKLVESRYVRLLSLSS